MFSFSSVPSRSLCLTVSLSSRKIPGLNVYAQMQNEKEQEMMSPADPTEATPSSQQDLVHSLEILDTELNSRPIGTHTHTHIHSCFLLLHASMLIHTSVSSSSKLILFLLFFWVFFPMFLRDNVVESDSQRQINRERRIGKYVGIYLVSSTPIPMIRIFTSVVPTEHCRWRDINKTSDQPV